MGVCTVVGIPGEAGEQIHIGHGEKCFQLLGQPVVIHGGVPAGQISIFIRNDAVIAVHLGVLQICVLNVQDHLGQVGDRGFV